MRAAGQDVHEDAPTHGVASGWRCTTQGSRACAMTRAQGRLHKPCTKPAVAYAEEQSRTKYSPHAWSRGAPCIRYAHSAGGRLCMPQQHHYTSPVYWTHTEGARCMHESLICTCALQDATYVSPTLHQAESTLGLPNAGYTWSHGSFNAHHQHYICPKPV